MCAIDFKTQIKAKIQLQNSHQTKRHERKVPSSLLTQVTPLFTAQTALQQ